MSFFPQLVIGPIERASNLLPQILNNRMFKYEQGVQGLRLILLECLKVVIADNLAPFVDDIFENFGTYSGGVLLGISFIFHFKSTVILVAILIWLLVPQNFSGLN